MNSPLVTYENITNKSNAREKEISKVTIHHYAGVVSTKRGTDYLTETSRDVSANYVIGDEGGVGLNVPENRRAWTSSSPWNDHRAVTIEVSNSTLSPTFEISKEAMATLIKLVADICKRNGIDKLWYDGTTNGTLTLHEMFTPTNCPGPYIKKNLGYIQDEVNKLLGHDITTPTEPVKPNINGITSYLKPKGTYSEKGRFTNTASDFIYMRQYVPNTNGVENGKLQPGDYVDYQDVYIGNGFVWVGNGTTWIPTGIEVNGKNENPWGTFTPQSQKETVSTGLKSSGTLKFGKLDFDVIIRDGEVGMAGADTGVVYKSGMTVNYDRTYTRDGHTWVSYIGNSGRRRSVAVGKGNTLWGTNI